MDMSMEGAVFVQTNAAHNEVIAFSRAADGSLTRAGDPQITVSSCVAVSQSKSASTVWSP